LFKEGAVPSQELLDANPALANAWKRKQVWDLIRVNQEPTKEQRSDPNFMAAWDIVNKTAAAANARVRHLVKEGVVPSQERLDAEPALANAWKTSEKSTALGRDLCFVATVHSTVQWQLAIGM
jgi:hypothetical protein